MEESAREKNQSAGGDTQISPQSLIIDRHVLTENEVLPSLEANLSRGQSWTSRHQRSLRSSIVYRFRVYCALNYFGDGCMTFCRPRNDQFGHYNCSPAGHKLCHEGWTGPDCDRAKCRPGCNLQHGFCERPDTCQCRPGWTGARCDECITYPGCQNGYCLSPWQCHCQANWGGLLCDQDLNYCGSHDPCRNNATCQNVAPGRYKCLCAEGFAGANCETSLGGGPLSQLSAGCALNPCLNGGTCYTFNATPPSTQPGEQHAGGTTNEPPTPDPLAESELYSLGNSMLHRCQCPAGWTGDYCQWAEALAVPISELVLDASSANLSAVVDSPPSVSTLLSTLTNSGIPTSSDEPGSLLSQMQANNNATTTDLLSLGELGALDELTTVSSSNALNNQRQQHQQQHMEMRHLISGVMLASAVGVFAAALLLAWCCLVAIERNRLSFVQMNIVRQAEAGQASGQPEAGSSVGTALRRVQEKIGDSFRRRSQIRGRQIKPETKLSLDNVLRGPKPPPSYEESNYACMMASGRYSSPAAVEAGQAKLASVVPLQMDQSASSLSQSPRLETSEEPTLVGQMAQTNKLHSQQEQHPNLVNEKEMIVPVEYIANARAQRPPTAAERLVSQARLSCPRHGHLYRKKCQLIGEPNQILNPDASTTIEIEYQTHYQRYPRDLG